MLGLQTLEAVFLRIAKDAEIEAAQAVANSGGGGGGKGSREGIQIQCEVEHESLHKGVAQCTVSVGSDRQLMELVTGE